MALSLSCGAPRVLPATRGRAAVLAPPRASPSGDGNNTNTLSSMMQSVGAALVRNVFSPPSRDNADVGGGGGGGFSGKLPARHGAARRPFASAGPMGKVAPAASPTASMSSIEEEEDDDGGGGGAGGGGPAKYLSGALGRVFGGQAGMGDPDMPPTTGAIGWPGEAASRRHSQRRRGIGGGF
jgi:hypothetical protein